MSSKKLFSRFLAKSLLVSTAVSCFGCCVSAMEFKNKYDTKTATINKGLVFKILENSTRWVMLKYLKRSKDIQNIPALLRNTKIDLNINLLKQDIVKFLDEKYEKYEKYFKEVEECSEETKKIFKNHKEIFKNHVVAAKQTLEQPDYDSLIRMFVLEFLRTNQKL